MTANFLQGILNRISSVLGVSNLRINAGLLSLTVLKEISCNLWE